MKRFFVIIILSLMWFNNSFSEQLPTKLFNIKLYDKIYDYASAENKPDPRLFYEGYESYVDTQKNPIRKLKKNSNFSTYIIGTNLKSDIHRISGSRGNSIFTKYFEDECQLKQEKIKSSLVQLYEFKRNSLKKIFYIEETQTRTFLYRTYQYEYRKNLNRIILSLECRYYLRNTNYDDKEVVWSLNLELMDKQYYENTQKKGLKKIKPFDKDFIISDISGF